MVLELLARRPSDPFQEEKAFKTHDMALFGFGQNLLETCLEQAMNTTL